MASVRYLKTGDISYLFKGALTPEECKALIATAERRGVPDSTTYVNRDVLLKQRRTKFEDYKLSDTIYQKVKARFEKAVRKSYVANDTMITYVVYENSGECPLHRDSKVQNNIGKEEYITVIVYLNSFEGGRTYFSLAGGRRLYADVEAGDIMVFHGTKLPHGCEPVIGTKKILIFGIEKA